jgi:hypothetical protein
MTMNIFPRNNPAFLNFQHCWTFVRMSFATTPNVITALAKRKPWPIQNDYAISSISLSDNLEIC